MASPQVRTIEIDLSQRVPGFEGLTGLIVGAFDKGPVNERVFISNHRQADVVLGKPSVSSDVAYHVMHSFLDKSKRLWCVRVANGATFGGMSIGAMYDIIGGVGDGTATNFSFNLPYNRCLPNTVEIWLDKRKIGYDDGSGVINGDGVAGTVNYQNGLVTLVFSSPVPNTAKIHGRWGFPNETLSSGLAAANSYTFNGRQTEMELAFSGLVYNDILTPGLLYAPTTVTGVSTASVVIYDGTTAVAYADASGNLVDISGTFLDAGATNNVDYATGAIQFTIQNTYTVGTPLIAKYQSKRSELAIVTADNPGKWADNFFIGIDDIDQPRNTWRISVYERDERGFYNRVDAFPVSREYKVDGLGYQMFLEDRINGKSYYIRTLNNTALNPTEAMPASTMPHTELTKQSFVQLANGTNGLAPSVSDYINALQLFANKEDINIDIVMDTLTDSDYQQAIIKLCDRDYGGRGDCYAILNTPLSVSSSNSYVNEAINYRNYSLVSSSSFAGLYFGHVKIVDTYNGRDILIPYTGFVGAAFSYTADQTEPWFGAAGWNRGRILVKGVDRRLTLSERDILYDNDINALRFRPGKGVAIWGQKTLYGTASALDRANVRMLLIVVENAIEEFLEDFLFEVNDDFTRRLVVSGVSDYLESIKNRRGLYKFSVISDETNNPPVVIDNNELYVDYYLQPIKLAETIYGRAIITRTGVNFSDVQLIN